ncbi:hypothetical protein HWI79_3250 [Cryptosporidium felis]|nr:hypothetical protein HWI79_3250 [Cryptosporidium felis]
MHAGAPSGDFGTSLGRAGLYERLGTFGALPWDSQARWAFWVPGDRLAKPPREKASSRGGRELGAPPIESRVSRAAPIRPSCSE